MTAILLGRASPCLWHQFNNTVASACSSGLKAVPSSHRVSPWVPQHHLLVPLKEFHQNEPYFSSGCWLQLSTQDADTFLFFSFLLLPFLLSCGKNTWDTPSWQIFKCVHSDKYMQNVPQQSLELTILQNFNVTPNEQQIPISHTPGNHHSTLYLWVCFRYFIQLESWTFALLWLAYST